MKTMNLVKEIAKEIGFNLSLSRKEELLKVTDITKKEEVINCVLLSMKLKRITTKGGTPEEINTIIEDVYECYNRVEMIDMINEKTRALDVDVTKYLLKNIEIMAKLCLLAVKLNSKELSMTDARYQEEIKGLKFDVRIFNKRMEKIKTNLK